MFPADMVNVRFEATFTFETPPKTRLVVEIVRLLTELLALDRSIPPAPRVNVFAPAMDTAAVELFTVIPLVVKFTPRVPERFVPVESNKTVSVAPG